MPQHLSQSDFTRLANVGDAVVAFPDSGHSYWSTDGRNWNGIPPGAGPQGPIALAGDGAHLWALTGGRDAVPVTAKLAKNALSHLTAAGIARAQEKHSLF